jgi:excisionase family DNA binding protein
MTSPYLTPKEAAAYVKKSYRAFDHIVRRHGIPYVRIGRERRFLPDKLDQAMKALARRASVVALLLVAVPASAQEVRVLYPAFVTARVLDLTSTHQALKAGATEINPLMKHPAMRYALHPLMTVGFVAAAEKARAQGKGKRAFWLMVAGTAGQFALDYSNYRQAATLRERK